MRDIYELKQRLADIRVINAYGLVTRLGGSLYSGPSTDIVDLAYRSSYDIVDLQTLASEVIVEGTQSEAAIVTCGAAAGLLLGAAACLARGDASVMDDLPVTCNIPNEIIIGRSHRNAYDHALRGAGAILKEVGIPDRVAGAGVRDVEVWEYEAAIGPMTAAIAYVVRAGAQPALTELCAMAKRHGVPVIVDAAAQLPPAKNLSRFIAEGADLVVFSGGKAIGGPQASGVLCGRRDLVASALLQNLDLDVDETDRSRLLDQPLFRGLTWRGFPHHGIGRSAKASKETIIPFLLAYLAFINGGERQFLSQQASMCAELCKALNGRNDVECRVVDDHPKYKFPIVEIVLRQMSDVDGQLLRHALASHQPSIHMHYIANDPPALLLNLGATRQEDVTRLARILLLELQSRVRTEQD